MIGVRAMPVMVRSPAAWIAAVRRAKEGGQVNRKSYELIRLHRVDRSAWSSIKTFCELAGKWWVSVWLLTVLSGAVSFGLTVANVAQLPTTLWLALLLAGLVLAPSVAFHSLRIQRDSYRSLWGDKHAVIRVLNDLEEL